MYLFFPLFHVFCFLSLTFSTRFHFISSLQWTVLQCIYMSEKHMETLYQRFRSGRWTPWSGHVFSPWRTQPLRAPLRVSPAVWPADTAAAPCGPQEPCRPQTLAAGVSTGPLCCLNSVLFRQKTAAVQSKVTQTPNEWGSQIERKLTQHTSALTSTHVSQRSSRLRIIFADLVPFFSFCFLFFFLLT